MDSFLKKVIRKYSFIIINGAIYICNINRMLAEKTLFLPSNCYGYVMSRKSSIDIDDQIDFDLAEIYLNRSKASM